MKNKIKKIVLVNVFLTVFCMTLWAAGPYLVNYYIPYGEKIPHPTVKIAYLFSLGIYTAEGYTYCEEYYCPPGQYFNPTFRECTPDLNPDKD